MRLLIRGCAVSVLAALCVLGAPISHADQALSDAEIRSKLIAESVAAYPGNCPCPYNLASNGSHCGKRSAWSRPGGYSPLCYDADITAEMIRNYRRSHGG